MNDKQYFDDNSNQDNIRKRVKIQEIPRQQIDFENVLSNNVEQIQIKNSLVFKRIQTQFQGQNADEITFLERTNMIKITGSKEKVEKIKQDIFHFQTQYELQLNIIAFMMEDKEWKYLQQNKKYQLEVIEDKHQCIISQSQIIGINVLTLKLKNKQINLRFGDIAESEMEAIVNFQYEIDQLDNYQKRIQQIGGQEYLNSIISQVNNSYPQLFQVKDHYKIKLIITAPISYYIYDGVVNLQGQIENIFNTAQFYNFNSLLIPIIYKLQTDVYYLHYLQTLIDAIIKCTDKYNINEVQLLYQTTDVINDVSENRIEKFIQIFQDISGVNKEYYNKWFKLELQQNNFYEDFTNKQINKGWNQYLSDKQKNEISLVFPYNTKNATHIIDLNKMKVIDMQTNYAYTIFLLINIEQGSNKKLFRYYFNHKPVNDIINDYIIIQRNKQNMRFEIFDKEFKIIFSDRQIQQIDVFKGEKINLERQIVINQKYNVQFIKHTILETLKPQIQVLTFGKQARNAVEDILKLKVESQSVIEYKILNFRDDDLISLENLIKKYSVSFKGQVRFGNAIQILCMIRKGNKLNMLLKQFESEKMQYPNTWKPQNENLLKIELKANDDEYKMVSNLFQKTYKGGKIYQVFRIQNKALYENFSKEKQKLLSLKKSIGENLSQSEQSIYLWHGVKQQHPYIIYSGNQEAFKINFGNKDSMWGPGVYFAGAAKYSKDYSFQLEESNYKGKLVFLLCEVMTGQISTLNPNNNIKEPPQGYDCVKAIDSEIYILYGMDARRAYPSFEVIFE